MSRKQIVHVAQTAIRSRSGRPIIIRDYRDYLGAERADTVNLVNPVTDEVLGRFVYSPDKPLGCGARLWLELHTDKLEARVV